MVYGFVSGIALQELFAEPQRMLELSLLDLVLRTEDFESL